MSREIKEIHDEMIMEKETHALLDGLTPKPDSAQGFLDDLSSPSKVSTWRTFMRNIASAIKFHEDLFDAFRDDVEARAVDIIPSTARKLVIIAKEFQYGDSLVFDSATGKFSYEDTISADAAAKRIITQASVLDANRVVTYKVAKSDPLEKLVSAELTAFTTYIDETKVAGTKTVIVSDDADFLKLAFTIEYNPLVLKSDGSLISDGTFPIQEAITGYIEGLPFNSVFRVQELTDAIQANATGAVNVVADVVEAADSVQTYTDVLGVNTESYQPFAGYFKTVDETGSEATPVYGDIPVLTNADYDATILYAFGDFARFGGVMYKANVAITVAEAFDSNKWDTVSNITFISAS